MKFPEVRVTRTDKGRIDKVLVVHDGGTIDLTEAVGITLISRNITPGDLPQVQMDMVARLVEVEW